MNVLDLYRQSGALLQGHFLLRSGKHSAVFLQSAALLQHPLYAEAVGEAIAARYEDESLDFVIGPAIGGVVLSFVVAKALGVRALFAEKDHYGGMFIRPGLTVKPGERFLAVEDVVTTGASLKKTIGAAEKAGAVAAAAAAIIDRSGGAASFGLPFAALAALEAEAYPADSCPLCAQNVPLEEV